MNIINEFLHHFLFKGVIVSLDDVLIYSEDHQPHLKLVREVLKTLYQNKLFARLSECQFHKSELDYLEYWIFREGLKMDLGKIQDMLA